MKGIIQGKINSMQPALTEQEEIILYHLINTKFLDWYNSKAPYNPSTIIKTVGKFQRLGLIVPSGNGAKIVSEAGKNHYAKLQRDKKSLARTKALKEVGYKIVVPIAAGLIPAIFTYWISAISINDLEKKIDILNQNQSIQFNNIESLQKQIFELKKVKIDTVKKKVVI